MFAISPNIPERSLESANHQELLGGELSFLNDSLRSVKFDFSPTATAMAVMKTFS